MDEPTYTVFVRVPIPRGDFVDPPPVNWDSTKDDALWKILSGAAQTEIDWNNVADRFGVPVDFLLKQVDYLTERHASQVRAQVRKATAAAKGTSSHSASPVPGSDSAAGIRSLRRDSHAPRYDGSGPGTPLNASTRPIVSRNISATTAVLRDGGASSTSPASSGRVVSGPRATDSTGGRRRLSSLPIASNTEQSPTPSAEPEAPADAKSGVTERSPSPGPPDSSSTVSSEDESSPVQSRIIRRPPRFQNHESTTAYGDDEAEEDDESEPAFQPYRPAPESGQTSAQDLNSTLRGQARPSSAFKKKAFGRENRGRQSQTSDSDTSSAAPVSRGPRPRDPAAGPLSPRRTAELAKGSPGGKGSREGSDGTPSMGSSFSDLDDASVTQSALEEALASHMNRGAGSRFSISQAFRSRYMPSGNQ